jgi:hypothetical protein
MGIRFSKASSAAPPQPPSPSSASASNTGPAGDVLAAPAGLTPRRSADAPPAPLVEIPVPDIRQKRLNACGDACIQIVLAHHGLPHAGFGTNARPALEGLSREELIDALQRHGIHALQIAPAERGRVAEAELQGWLGRHGPLIGLTRDHCILVTGAGGGRATIHCPLLGRRVGSMDELNGYLDWSGRRSPLLRTMRASGMAQAEVEPADTAPPEPARIERAAVRLLAKVEQAGTRRWQTSRR